MTDFNPDPTDSKQNATERIQAEWTLGSYSVLAQMFLGMAAELVDAAAVGPGDRVLDVACGTGNVALTADRRGADVTGVDITPAMLSEARERAAVTDAAVDWREGDVTALPLSDDAYDATLSCLGHVFAHDANAAGNELVRVTEPGGRIAFTSWTPESGIAAMVGTLSEYMPSQDESAPPPVLWGDPNTVRERFGDRVADLRFETETLRYPALSPAHFWESMTRVSGAIMLMVDEVDERERSALRTAEVDALAPHFSDRHNAMELEYRLVTGRVV